MLCDSGDLDLEDFLSQAWGFASGNAIISGLIVASTVGVSSVLLGFLKRRGSAPDSEESHTQVVTIESPSYREGVATMGEGGASNDYNELRAHHDALPPLARSEFSQHIIGLKINWVGYLENAGKKGDILDLTFKVGDLGSIYVEVPYIGHEFIALAKHGAEFKIEGVIERLYSIGNLIVHAAKLKST